MIYITTSGLSAWASSDLFVAPISAGVFHQADPVESA